MFPLDDIALRGLRNSAARTPVPELTDGIVRAREGCWHFAPCHLSVTPFGKNLTGVDSGHGRERRLRQPVINDGRVVEVSRLRNARIGYESKLLRIPAQHRREESRLKQDCLGYRRIGTGLAKTCYTREGRRSLRSGRAQVIRVPLAAFSTSISTVAQEQNQWQGSSAGSRSSL